MSQPRRVLLPSLALLCVTLLPGRRCYPLHLALDSLAVTAQPAGLAWHVEGAWHSAGSERPIHTGDGVLPGELVEADGPPTPHSITVLLPDGQRVLGECFDRDSCDRGFQIPELATTPPNFAVHMLESIRNVVSTEPSLYDNDSRAKQRTTPPVEQEAVVTLPPSASSSASHSIQLSTAVANLPDGSYVYDLRPWQGTRGPALFAVPLPLHGDAASFAVPGAGLYRITIRDALNTSRVDLLVAVISPQQAAVQDRFTRAQKLLTTWNSEFYGWPVHPLLRAYLRALLS